MRVRLSRAARRLMGSPAPLAGRVMSKLQIALASVGDFDWLRVLTAAGATVVAVSVCVRVCMCVCVYLCVFVRARGHWVAADANTSRCASSVLRAAWPRWYPFDGD